MRRDNKGLDFTGATSVDENGRLVYGKSVKKTNFNKIPKNTYTDEERRIIGECVIYGKLYPHAKFRVLNEGSGNTILNDGHYQCVNRIRKLSGVEGVEHWMKPENKKTSRISFYRYGQHKKGELV